MSDFKIKVGAEFDASGLDAAIRKSVNKEYKAKINIDVDTKSIVNKLKSTYKQMNSLKRQQIKLDVDSSEYKTLDAEINRLVQRAATLQSRLSGNLPNNIFDDIVEDSTRAEAAIKRVESSIADARKQQAKNITKQIDNGTFTRSLKEMESSIGNLKNPNLLAGNLRNLREAYQALGNLGPIVDDESFNRAKIAVDRYNDALTETRNRYKTLKSQQDQVNRSIQSDNAARSLENAKKTFSLQIDNWLNSNSAAEAQFGDRLRDIQGRITNINNSADLSALRSEFTQTTLEAKNADVAMMSFGDRLKRQAREYMSYVGIAGLVMAGSQAFRQMAQNVLEVDTAMTGLYRVTDLTAAQYDQLYADMISASKEYGATLTDTINATSDWVRAGFDANTALGLADVTAMYQHVSDLDYDEASENLLTAYNGFKDSFNEEFGGDAVASVEHIADAFNELDNKYSVTSAGLGEGLARSASALELAGNTFEEAAALIGATSEVTQDPEKAGNAMKTLSLRLRGMKGELEDLGEESEGVENISKMQGQILNLTNGKVNIFDNLGNFRSTYDILKDIASIYDELTSTQQADLLETIAGKNRANDVAALIGNFDNAIKMVETAENSAGSAANENAKYLDSLQGRIDVMTSSLQALSTSALNSDFLKGGVSSITALVDVFTSLVDTVGLLPTLLAAAGTGFSVFGKGIVTVDKANSRLQIFGKSLGDIKGILGSFASGGFGGGLDAMFGNEQSPFVGFAERLEKDKQALQRYQDLMNTSANATTEQIGQALSGASDELRQYVNNTEFASQSVEDFSTAQRQQFVALQAQNRGFKSSASILREYNNGCRNVGMTQAQFAEAVGTSNPVMGSYLSGLNGAQASMGGYATSLIGATAKTVALTVASTALNAVLTMGIGLAISAAITGIMSLINHESELAETVTDATTSFKQQHDELTKNKSSFDDAAASYAKLADGVNSVTGKNMSLTPDEYEEYLNAVNTIADMTPSLVAGYDEQGNAILNAAGNVDTLTEAYNNLIIAENNKLLNGDGEDYKGVSDISEDLKNSYKDIEESVNYAELLNDVFNSGDVSPDNIIDKIGNDTKQAALKVAEAMKDANKEIEGVEPPNIWTSQEDSAKYLSEVYKQYPNVIRDMTNEVTAELDTSAESMRSAISAHMENAFLGGDYENLDSEMQSLATSLVDGLDSNVIAQLNSTGGEDAVFEYIDNILSTLDGMGADAQEKLKSSFDLQNLFNSGEISLGDYRSQLQEVGKLIEESGLDEEIQTQLELSLNIDEVQNEWQSFVNRMTESGMEYSVAVDFANSLDANEWAAAQQLVVDGEIKWKDKTPEEIRAEIESLAAYTEAMNYTIDISAETEGIDNFNTALSESKAATGLTAESISALESRYSGLEDANYDAARLFEETANGIRLNTEEVNRLEEAYAEQQKQDIDGNLETLSAKYEELGTQIQNCSDINERAELYAEREDVRAKINELAELGAAYDGLTSQYKQWQDAESAGSDRDMYESILSGFESIDDEISRGWLDDATKEFIELMSPDEKTFSSIDDYIGRWNELDDTIKGTTYSVRDFFTQNEDGESTNNGVYNFLDAVDQLNDERFKIERNANGVITSFDFGVNGDKAVADALGISEELVQIIERASEDAGFVINMNGAYTQLADLQNQAEISAQKLRELGKTDFNFDFDTTSLQSLEDQLTEADRILSEFKNEDGTIKTEFINDDGSFTEDAQAAIDVMSTLTAMADKLSEPVYMQLETNQVDESLQDTLSDLQEYEGLVKQKHQLEITGADTSEVDAAMKEIADKIANDDDLKVKLGIDADASTEDIQNMLEAGEIEIPATVDIQAEISDDLKDIRLLLMHQAGMISDTELQLSLELDTTAVDSYTPEEKEAVVNFLADTEDVDKYTPEQKSAIAKYIKDVDDVESWTPQDKTAVCDFIVNNADVMEYSPEEKAAVAKYIVDGGDVENYDIPDQTIIAKFIADHGAVDSWKPEDREAVARFLLDSSEVDNYEPENKQGTAIYSVDDAKVSRWLAPTKQGTAVYTPKLSTTKLPTLQGTANYTVTTSSSSVRGHVYGQSTKVDGTAHVNGTAFKRGSWGTKDSGTALVGELGQETVVRDGRFFTIGDNGAEFFNYKKGDIIFNHKFLFVALLRNK